MRPVCQILKESKNIAVVGISNKPGRVSGSIAKFLKESGYNVCGVHPLLNNINGIKIYRSLMEIDFEIDIVNVFRRSSSIPELIPDVLKVKPKVLWLQSGIRNDEAVKPVINEGIEVIQNMCISVQLALCS